MRSRIFFLAIVSFWLVMNYLLWRSQWGAHSRLGSQVPPEVVWEKILTAPDSSSLNIFDHGKRIGVCHWIANAANAPLAAIKLLDNDYAPDGAATPVTGYSLIFEGNANLPNSNRLGFETTLDLSTNRTWRNLHARVSIRPVIWDVFASVATEKLALKIDDNHVIWQRTFAFSELQNPDKLLEGLGGTAALGLLAGVGLTPSGDSNSALANSVQWQAHEDWMQFGRTKARAYRLETVFLGNHIRLFTSRVGEILLVELPNKITLRNEAFENF
jgi:hypothetical protein